MASTVPWGVISTLPNQNKSKESKEKGVSSAYSTEKMNILEIKDLHVSVKDKEILKGIDLVVKEGEIHAIMGPNGNGKSTLLQTIMGNPNYKVEHGQILYDDIDITNLSVDERAKLGIFLGMQSPLEIEGVTTADFLRNVLSNNNDKFKLFDFIKQIEKTTEKLEMDKDMIHRDLNLGFSGGEKKKNEILQMYMLKPSLVILDEIDSGLDVDSLRIVGTNVTNYFKEAKPGLLLITHYQRLLDYIKPDFVHVIIDGKIVKTGDFSLVKEIEEKGYDVIKKNNKTGTGVIEEFNSNE